MSATERRDEMEYKLNLSQDDIQQLGLALTARIQDCSEILAKAKKAPEDLLPASVAGWWSKQGERYWRDQLSQCQELAGKIQTQIHYFVLADSVYNR